MKKIKVRIDGANVKTAKMISKKEVLLLQDIKDIKKVFSKRMKRISDCLKEMEMTDARKDGRLDDLRWIVEELELMKDIVAFTADIVDQEEYTCTHKELIEELNEIKKEHKDKGWEFMELIGHRRSLNILDLFFPG